MYKQDLEKAGIVSVPSLMIQGGIRATRAPIQTTPFLGNTLYISAGQTQNCIYENCIVISNFFALLI